MTTALFMLGGIAVILGIVVLLDWLARRKDRQSRRRPAA
jgi:flagellar biogenesis protein FliO